MQEDGNKITYFAKTNSRGKETSFGIKRKDRARHMYVIGKTGMGKSTLLENMAIQDIRNGEGMAFIDPHGQTAERLLEYVPKERAGDVLYFAPFDMDHPVAFNVMEDVGYDKRHLVVSGLLSAFRKIWVDAWSARMEYILSNTLLALLEYPGATLLDINRMLINKAFRKKVVENVTDPIVKSFWVDEFANYTDRYTQDATPAIQNKVGQFTSNPLIRNIVGQPKSSFDIRRMMDERKIIIMNLSKGRVGEVNATLLGSMLVTKIYLAAMSRADVAASALDLLPSFYFYVDEFQTFANQSFADILSEARKYKLCLIIAHQYIEQMEEEVRDAVFGNVGTTIAFRVGPFDAEVLETIFQPQFTQTDLVNLGFAQIYLTLMIDGVGSPPFSATTMAPFDLPPHRFKDEAIRLSREQFSKSRTEVEGAIKEWHALEQEPPKPPRAPRVTTAPRAPRPVYTENPPIPTEPRPETPPPRGFSASPAGGVRHSQAQGMGKDIGQRHVVATSQAGPAEDHRPQSVPRQKGVPERPPLGGTGSLREALARATVQKQKEEEVKARAPEEKKDTLVHAPDLKDTLGKVAPKAGNKQEEKQPADIPKEVLQKMLAVDERGKETPASSGEFETE